MIIDTEDLYGHQTVFLVKYPTGVFYTVQVGGMACLQEKVEGFVIPLGEFFSEFNTCLYGCDNILGNTEIQEKLAYDIDVFLKEHTRFWSYQLFFDYGRIKELKEGFIPVIAIGNILGNNTVLFGYLHNGNCD